MNYGEKIAFLRKKSGMTQADLGNSLNVTYQAVSKWERGESHPDFETLSKIAKLFHVPISYFESDDGEVACTDTAATANAETLPAANAVDVAPAVRTLVGTCTECGKVIYEGDEYVSDPKLVCKSCSDRAKQAMILKKKQEEAERKKAEQEEQKRIWKKREALRKNRNRGLWISAIIAVIVLIVFAILSALPFNKLGVAPVFCGGFFIALFLYCFMAQVIWGGLLREMCLGGGHVMRLPLILFTLSPEGILSLIVTKIFLGLLAILVFVASILVCIMSAIVVSPFTFIPALIRRNREIKTAR